MFLKTFMLVLDSLIRLAQYLIDEFFQRKRGVRVDREDSQVVSDLLGKLHTGQKTQQLERPLVQQEVCQVEQRLLDPIDFPYEVSQSSEVVHLQSEERDSGAVRHSVEVQALDSTHCVYELRVVRLHRPVLSSWELLYPQRGVAN